MEEPNPFAQFDGLRSGARATVRPPPSSDENPFAQFDELRDRGPSSSFGSIARQLPAGFNEGLADVAGAPVDVATWALNLIPRGVNAAYNATRAGTLSELITGPRNRELIPTIKHPFLGSESIKSGMGLIGANPDELPARTTAERIARGIGGGVAAAVAPEAIVGAVARAVPAATRTAEGLAKTFGRTESGGDLAATTAAGAAAGGGGEAAAELAPDAYKPLARTVGSLAAGVPVAAVPGVVQEATRLGKNFIAPMREAGREELAGGRLANAASDVSGVREALDTAPRELVPGSKPTTFQLTGDVGLGALEREVQTRNPADFAERRGEQNAARVQTVQRVQPTGAPEEVSSFLRSQLADIDQTSQRLIDAATARAQGKAASLGGQIAPNEFGVALRSALQDAEDTARAGERGLWNAVDPDRTLTVAMGPVQNAERSIYGDMTAAAEAGLTPIENTIRKVIGTYQGVEPFRELSDLRSAVSSAMRAEQRSSGNSPAYARLTRLRGAVEQAITDTVEERVTQEARAVASGQLSPEHTMAAQLQADINAWRAREAEAGRNISDAVGGGAGTRSSPSSRPSRTEVSRGIEPGTTAGNQGIQGTEQPSFDAAARERLNAATEATKERARTFNQGPIGQILRTQGDKGNFRMADSAVPGGIFRPGPGGYEAVQAFRRAVSNDADAVATLQDAVAASARRYAQRPDGTIDPGKLSRWRTMHTDALRAVPGVAGRFADAAKAATSIDAAAEARKAAIDAYAQGAIGRLIGVDDPADVIKTVGGIFARNDAVATMRRLAQEAGKNPDARDGLRKALVDYMYERFVSNTEAATSRLGQIKNDTFQTFVKQNRAALREVLSEGETNALTAIAADLQRASRSLTSIRIPGQSNTAQDTIAALVKKPDGHRSLLMQVILAGGAGFEVHGAKGAALGVTGALGKYFTHKLREAGMEKVEDLVKQAMLDPDTARYLLSRAPANSAASNSAKMKLAQRVARLSVFEQAQNKEGSRQ